MPNVTDVVAKMRAGELTLAQAASEVGAMSFDAPGQRPKDVVAAMDAADDTDYLAPGTWNGEVRRLELTGELSPEEYDAFSKAKDSAGS